MAKVSPSERKIKKTAECKCGATMFQGPTQTVEVVDEQIVVKQQTLRCLRCHDEYTLEELLALPPRVVELPG